jgi:endonuclease-8
MPEGHTIHRLARGLRSTLAGGPVDATSPQGRFAGGAALLDGEHLQRTEAFGKYLFVTFTGGQILHIHLGLIGKFRDRGPEAPDPTPTIRLRLQNPDCCWDLTGPTRCELVTPKERRSIVARIGADPLRRSPDVAAARSLFARTTKPVGAVLLDQTVIAGLGNIYRAEILFLCGIHPLTPCRDLADDDFGAIWAESARLLRVGVRTGRIITTDPREVGVPLRRMDLDDTLYVYHREHCRRCGTDIATVELAGRPIQFCPSCQER